MNDPQENKLTMAKATDGIMDANASIVGGIPKLAEAATALKAAIADIDATVVIQNKPTEGPAADKEAAKGIAIEKALEICGGIQAMGEDTNNNTLFEQGNYTESGLDGMRDTELPATLKGIRDTALGVATELEDFGVTSTMITEFSGAIAAYEVSIPVGTNKMNVRTAATNKLVTDFNLLDKVLAKLDDLMSVQKNSHPDFYNAYKAARVIIDLGGGGSSTPPPPGP